MRLRALIIFLAAVGASASIAAQTPHASLLVLSKQDHALSIVDPSTLKVLGKIPSGDDPHEVVASADGRTAYISNYGFGAFHTLTAVDLVNRAPLRTIDLGALYGPHGLMFAQGKVWFTAEAAKVIGRYDPASERVDWVMGTGQNRTHMLYVFPGAQRILTTNVNSATVTILDHSQGPAGMAPGPPPGMAPPSGMPPLALPAPRGGDWNETVVPVGRGSEGFDVTPDSSQAWVANALDGTISVIDLARKSVSAALQANTRGANRLKFSPDGKLAFVSAGPELVVFDVAAQKAVKRIPVGQGTGGILVQPDGARVYVACSGSGYVAVVDVKTMSVVGHIEAGGNPDGMAWAVQE
jgi:YVTN family beta-propeller protein